MDYKKKYLKYKNKYLNAKKLYGGDRMTIHIKIDDEEQTISVRSDTRIIDDLHTNILNENLGLPHDNTRFILEGITLGKETDLDLDKSWIENEIDDGALLIIHQRERATFENVVLDVINLNQHLSEKTLKRLNKNLQIYSDEPWHIRGNLNWGTMGIYCLLYTSPSPRD